jgi:hypothetical protein
MLFCVVCFYNEKCEGEFTIDYIYRDKLKAVQTAVNYSKKAVADNPRKLWISVYSTDSLTAQMGSMDDFYIYLDKEKKQLYMFNSKQDLKNLLMSKIPLPPIEKLVITEFDD